MHAVYNKPRNEKKDVIFGEKNNRRKKKEKVV